MFLLLVFSGALYAILGDIQEASMLLGFVFVVMGITIYQERKTERALDALRDLSSPRARVIRGGEQLRIPGQRGGPGRHRPRRRGRSRARPTRSFSRATTCRPTSRCSQASRCRCASWPQSNRRATPRPPSCGRAATIFPTSTRGR